MRSDRNYSWIDRPTSMDLNNQETRKKLTDERKKPRHINNLIVLKDIDFLWRVLLSPSNDGTNNEILIDSIADNDADVVSPFIIEKLKEDVTVNGAKQRLLAVKILARLVSFNGENKKAIENIKNEISKVHKEDKDTSVKIEATNQIEKLI